MEAVNAAFAPVNIAWIKYMGKKEGKPSNASLAMTLRETGTFVKLKLLGKEILSPSALVSLEFEIGSYLPPEMGKAKLQKFLSNQKIWREAIEPFGYSLSFPAAIQIFTQNNAPAATGIATSASSFAAFTLAWAAVLVEERAEDFKEQYKTDTRLKVALAQVSSFGSGSACRSFDGPWIEWHPERGIERQDFSEHKWVNLILLIDEKSKEVPSTEAHARVRSSPLFESRNTRVEERMERLKRLLSSPIDSCLSEIQKVVWEESEDMHSLFHTANPPFQYQTDKSRAVSQLVLQGKGPSGNVVMTMDAGANLHLFIPEAEKEAWLKFLKEKFPEIPTLVDRQGSGADYVDESFGF